MAKMEIYLENYFSVEDTIRKIEKVSAERLQETANELFDRDRIYSTVLKPQSSTGKEG